MTAPEPAIPGGYIPLGTMVALAGPPVRSSETDGPLTFPLCPLEPERGERCRLWGSADSRCLTCPHSGEDGYAK